jgi:hypothetical protein
MRSRCTLLALLLALALSAATPAGAGVTIGVGTPGGAIGGVAVKVDLEPENDPDGSGEATLSLDARRGQVCFEIEVNHVDPVVAVHIHAGAAGETNEDLLLIDLDFANEGLRGCTRAGRELLRSILDNVRSNDPEQFYLHVHTSGFSTGAVRGQLQHD